MNGIAINTPILRDKLYMEVKLDGLWTLHARLNPGTNLNIHDLLLQAVLTGEDTLLKADYEHNKRIQRMPRRIQTHQGLPENLSRITAHELGKISEYATPVHSGWLDAHMLDELSDEIIRACPDDVYYDDEDNELRMDVFGDILHAAVSTRNYLELGYEDIRLVYAYI